MRICGYSIERKMKNKQVIQLVNNHFEAKLNSSVLAARELYKHADGAQYILQIFNVILY